MPWPPITFEDTHTQNWFPGRGNHPMFVDCQALGAVMRWGFARKRPHREVLPWGDKIDPANGRGASCSDYWKTSPWDFEVNMEI